MSKLLYADLTNQRLRRSLGGAEFSFGTVPHIGTLSLGLRFSRQIGTRHVEVHPEVHALRWTIGPLDQRPEAGQFSLQVGGGAPVVGTNATEPLDHDCTAAELEAALKELAAASAAAVAEDDGSFLVTGVAAAIVVHRNTLRPISFVRVSEYDVDGGPVRAIRLQRAPFAFADAYDERVPRAPYVERVQAGGEIDGTPYPEIQKVTVPLEFNGSYRLRRSDPLRKSALLGVADGPDEIAEAINARDGSLGLADDADGVFRVEEHPTDPAMLVTFDGSMAGSSHDLLEIEVFDPPPPDRWIHLNPHTPMTEEALRDTDLVRRVPVEIHASLRLEAGDPVRPYCLYRGECSIQESVAHGDLATSQDIDWLNTPSQRQYPPVSPDSLASGSRYAEFLLGNGADLSFQIAHQLDSPRVRIHLRENLPGGRDLVPGTDYEVEHDSGDAATITFLGAYAAAPPAANAISGTAQDLRLTSSFDQHSHTIDEVDGLQDVLDALAAEIAELKAGNFGGAAPAAARISGKIERPLPRVWRVPRLRTLPPDPGPLRDWNPYGPEAPLRATRLLPAVHLAAENVEVLPSVLPPPTATHRGRVFYSATERLAFPGGGLPAGGFAACDGREWYHVVRESEEESTWYPAAFGFELFRLSVSPEELALRTRLDLAFGFECALIDPSRRPEERRTVARMSLLLERGVRTADTMPGTPGSNIADVFADPVVLLRHDFDLTAMPVQKRFGISIARSGSDVLTALATNLMQAAVPVSAPASADFLLRARIARFDVMNLPEDSRGLFPVRGLDVGLDGQADPTLGRLVIS